MGRHIAFDFGAESGRAIMGEVTDGILKLDELHRFPTQALMLGDTMHWNIYRFYEEILTGLRRYSEKYGSDLESIAVDTWGVDYGLVDADGELLRLPYHYRDSRNDGSDKKLEKYMDKRSIYEQTGIQFMQFNTLNQLTTEIGTNRLQQAAHLLFIGDILNYFLSGAVSTEYTIASTSQMVNPRVRDWDEKIFSAFGFPDACKTKIAFAGDVIGTLRPEICKLTGLNEGVKVIAAAIHDTASAATSIPAVSEHFAYISTGTWCMVGLETREAVITDAGYEMNLSNSAGSLDTNLLLKNVMGLWILQQCKREWNRTDRELGYGDIVKLAEQAEPFYAMIDPDDDLFLAPKDGAQAVAVYLARTGQRQVDWRDVGQIARIVIEGLAMKFRYVVEALGRATGARVDALHMIGGGTQNEMMCQFTANCLGKDVICGPIEATAAGNLLLQEYGCGRIDGSAALRAIVRNSFPLVSYHPQDTEKWQQSYEAFLHMLKK